MTNIALVVLDTLRKDAFDRHFTWLPGRRFERTYSTANWTVPAHASLFTGKYASEVGVHAKNLPLSCEETVLAERLSKNGYTTRAYSANTNVTPHFDFGRGFSDFRTPDQFTHLLDDDLFDFRAFRRETDATGVQLYFQVLGAIFKSDVRTIPSIVKGYKLQRSEDPTGVEYGGSLEALSELRSIDFGNREFLFLNLMEAHEPYRVPAEYQSVEVPDMTDSIGDLSPGSVDADQTRQAYDDCARYLSDEYTRIFDLLREEFDYIFTLSDHGEMLGEHDAWGHEHGVYSELTHVPLCIYSDELSGRSTETVSLCDVFETVLDIAGCTPTDGRGQTLLGGVEDRPCLTEYLGLTPWSEETVRGEYPEKLDLYDRPLRGFAEDDSYDYETIDGFEAEGTAPVESSRERLDSLVEDLNTKETEGDTEVPDAIKAQLKDLGYV